VRDNNFQSRFEGRSKFILKSSKSMDEDRTMSPPRDEEVIEQARAALRQRQQVKFSNKFRGEV